MLLKPFGPVHDQVIAPGLVVDAVRLSVLSEQTGELLPATGIAGVWCTTTFTVPAAEVQLLIVTVTLYVPVAAVVTLVIDGFWSVLIKPFGPVHA
jgi:hypothetical protein